ncbi:MAG: hypothetical protein AAGD11_20110 [Planctomycetota bacterium]
MESTALALLALSAKLSCISVMFGWQPMPDGSDPDGGDQVEYIVQIEPELAATLREGQSIPITSDIPSDIGRIGRIRIEVGRGELPRQSLASRFKPGPAAAEKKSRAGLVETQFTAPSGTSGAGSRYSNGTTSSSILPPGGSQSASANAFGQALQNGVQNARNAANEILPPSSDQLFGAGNGVGQSVQNTIDNTRNQLRQGIRGGIEQVADRTGQQLRQAVDNAGQRAVNAVDQFGRPAGSEQSILNNRQASNNSTILPPSANSSAPSIGSPQINQPLQPRRQQPQSDVPSSSFASSTQVGSNPTSQRGDFSAPWPSTTTSAAPPTNTISNPPSRYNNSSQQLPTGAPPALSSQQPPSGGFDIADRQPTNPPPRDAGYGQQNSLPTSNQMQGPTLNLPGQQGGQQLADQQLNNQQRSGPAITREMISNQQTSNSQNTGAPANFNRQRQVTARQPLNTQPGDFGWNQNAQQQMNANQSTDRAMFPLLLSWVLLSGSVTGNFYLFWSYLGVRSKYHGIVHGSPLRRDRYDG